MESAPVTVHIEDIPDGDAGTLATLTVMREQSIQRSVDPDIRRAAAAIVRDGSPVTAIRRFLSSRVRYLDDPTHYELVHDPRLLLQEIEAKGSTQGDCDDVATLGATLAMAVGLSARFTVAAFFREDAPYEHVWTEVRDPKSGRWVDLDTTRGAQKLPAIVSRQMTIDVSTGETVSSQLGFAIVPAVASGVALWNKIGPLLGSSREADRIAATDRAFSEAITGDDAALLFLRQRTGNYGVVTIPGMPGSYGGWGSESARRYAQQKYQEALNAIGTTNLPDALPQIAGVSPVILILGGLAVYALTKKRRSA